MAETNYARLIRHYRKSAQKSDMRAVQTLEAYGACFHQNEMNIAVHHAIRSFGFNFARDYKEYMAALCGASTNRFKIVSENNKPINLKRNAIIKTEVKRHYKLKKTEGGEIGYKSNGYYIAHGTAYTVPTSDSTYTINFDFCPVVNMNALSLKGTANPRAIVYNRGRNHSATIANKIKVPGVFPLCDHSQKKQYRRALKMAQNNEHKLTIKPADYVLWFIKVKDYYGRKVGKPALYFDAKLLDKTINTRAVYALPFVDIEPLIRDGFKRVYLSNSSKYLKRCSDVAGQHFELNIDKRIKVYTK